MGVVETMVHSESSRKLIPTDNSYSKEKSRGPLMENGSCSFHAGQPKYKRRNVSAIRNFPPGCGPSASRINLRPTQDIECAGSFKNPFGEHIDVTRTVEAVGGPSVPELMAEKLVIPSYQKDERDLMNAESMQSQFAKDLPASEKDGLNEHIKTIEYETSMPKDLHKAFLTTPREDMAHSSGLKTLSATGLEKAVARNYPTRRRLSAIRDFPPYCGRNAPHLSKEERERILASMDNKNLDQEISGFDDKPSNGIVKIDTKQTGEKVKGGNSHNKLEGDIVKQTETLTKDRVDSTVHCTKNVNLKDEFRMEKEDRRENCVTPSANISYRADNTSDKVVKKAKILSKEKLGKEIEVFTGDTVAKKKLATPTVSQAKSHNNSFNGLELASDRVTVHALMATPNCPWRQGKLPYKPNKAGSTTSERKSKIHDKKQLEKPKSVLRTKDGAKNLVGKFSKKKSKTTVDAAHGDMNQLVPFNEDNLSEPEYDDFHVAQRPRGLDVCLPPFGKSSLSGNVHESDAIVPRTKVRETLRLFQAVCRKLLQEEEARTKEQGSSHRRIDFQAAKILKDKGKYFNTGKKILGSVPGVEVGDEFRYRIELNIIGLHRPTQGGIDSIKHGGKILATSVVASGGYADDLDNSDVLIYTGQGGNVMNSDKQPEDQKLERGNLALKNSFDEKNSVRVIRGYESSDGRTYVYDGLYLVEKWWQDLGPHGKLVFKYQLNRIPGQPELAWKEVKKSKKYKIREGLCVDDISQGKELIPICAVNPIDDEKPPPFKYITRIIYPDWCRPMPPRGCDCADGCSDSEKCSCAVKNGGEIPFNFNGAIVEAKPLVYECSPSCKCPSSCHNRVSQHGIKFQLEIFKTKSRGWGVRSLNSIPSGGFICEYLGELLQEKEAEQRSNDEYLFDIGNNYNDNSLWGNLASLMPEAQTSSCEVVEDGSFTIDAAEYGNVGRFINHSCSPNLYAQNVLYDHEDKRIPHIMLFAAENIPPLQELTYHYNYVIDQVRDSNGNIKKKICHCGSVECTGRLY